RDQRNRIAGEILKGIAALREAEHNAAADQAERLRTMRNRLDTLRRSVEGAQSAARIGAGAAAELRPWQEFIGHIVCEVTTQIQTIHDALLAGRECCVE